MLQDGTVFKGKALGKIGTTTGEICFNTGMTGYQEIYTDPSYYGQVIVNTTAHIGNYGVKLDSEEESDSIKIKVMICNAYADHYYSRTTAYYSLQEYFEKGKSDDDRRKEVFDKMREILIKVDELDKGTGWDRLEKEIRIEFDRLEKVINELGNEQTNEALEKLRSRTDDIIRSRDLDLGKDVLEEIETIFVEVTLIYQMTGSIRRWSEHFSRIEWKNPSKVRQLLNQGLQLISTNPTEESLLPICIECENNLPDQTCNGCGRKESQCVCVS
jgi:hypothetical protein